MVKVFISHSTRDSRIVSILENYLKANGIFPYIAERDYQPGKSLSQKIISNIDTSDYFLVIYTHIGKESNYVNQEIGYWIKKMGYNNLIPLVEKGIIPEGLLSGVEYIEYNPNNPNVGISNAIKYLYYDTKEKQRRVGIGALLGLGILGLTVLAIIALSETNNEDK